MNKVIHLESIVKNYYLGLEIVEALRSVSLDINKNEYVTIMGPSGSGKSTLMNIIGCLDTPTSGTYILNNQNASKLVDNQLAEIRNKEIGFVSQTFNLLPRFCPRKCDVAPGLCRRTQTGADYACKSSA